MYAKIDICWINKHLKYIFLPLEITTSSFDKSWSTKVLKYSSGLAITYIKQKHRQTNQIVRSRKKCWPSSWGRKVMMIMLFNQKLRKKKLSGYLSTVGLSEKVEDCVCTKEWTQPGFSCWVKKLWTKLATDFKIGKTSRL